MLSNHRGFPSSIFKPGLAGFLAVFLFTFAPPGRAATVIFETTNLADTTPGEDLWQYSCTPGDFTFAAGQGFTVVFDRMLFAQLQSPPPFVNADWDPLTLQPDIALGSNGFYDALALRNAPSLADPFKVNVVWRGTGVPGSQPFTICDANFQPLVQGQTTNVPEPSAMVLLLAAVGFRVARSSRALAKASRLRELPSRTTPGIRSRFLNRRSREVRFGRAPKPTRETRALPGTPPLAIP